MSPVPVTATDLNFLNPFSPTVWFCWLLLYCLVSLLCRIASKRAADGDDSLLAFYLYAVPFLKRDQGLWADSRAKLLLISVWSFASVRTLSVLDGYFFASFLLQICSLKLIGAEIYSQQHPNRVRGQLENAEDLAGMLQRNPDMIFALVNASASKKKFEQRPEYQKLRAYLKYNPGQLNIFPNFDRILKRMLRQPGVVSICSVQGCKALRKKYPDLTCWPDKVQPEIITHYFVRKSDRWLANFLTKTALYLEEHGMNNYLKRAYGFGKAGEKLVAYWNSYRSISLGTLKSALTTMSFLVVGNFVFCLCCEVVYSNVRKSC